MNQPFTGTSGPAAAPCERGFMLTPLEWLGVERLRDLLGDRGLQDVVLTHLGRGYSIPAEHADVLLGDLFYATSLSLPPLQSIEREAA